nr:heme NO-binding domain-containing protein [Pontibacter pudoricolor]
MNSEEAMRGAVRKKTTGPILLNYLLPRKVKKQLIIDYYSKRRMAGVALGIVKGIARYFDESDSVDIMQLTPMDAERVQI